MVLESHHGKFSATEILPPLKWPSNLLKTFKQNPPAATLIRRNRVNGGCNDEPDATSEWEQWLARHARNLLLFARQQCHCEADACDLVQEAVVEGWRRCAEGVPPIGLVFATVRRRAVDLARRENRRLNREAAAEENRSQDWFDSGVEDRERNSLLQIAMNSLSDDQREVITLKVWCGLTFAEIGEVLEIPANTASSRYRYGLMELRKMTKEVFT